MQRLVKDFSAQPNDLAHNRSGKPK